LLAEHPLEHWKPICAGSSFTGPALFDQSSSDENFDFFARTLAGQEQQLRVGPVALSRRSRLGRGSGQAYVDRAFPAESKARTIEMVHAIERAMVTTFESVSWMTPQPRHRHIVKLKGIEDKIATLRYGAIIPA